MQKDSQKLNALAGIAPFIDVNKKRSIMKAFIELQYWYYCNVGAEKDKPCL